MRQQVLGPLDDDEPGVDRPEHAETLALVNVREFLGPSLKRCRSSPPLSGRCWVTTTPSMRLGSNSMPLRVLRMRSVSSSSVSMAESGGAGVLGQV